LVIQYWFSPCLREFVDNAHCYRYGDFTGVDVVFYGLMVGIPLRFAAVLVMAFGLLCNATVHSGQSPSPGMNVRRTTKYREGFKAKLRTSLIIALYFGLLCLGARLLSGKRVYRVAAVGAGYRA